MKVLLISANTETLNMPVLPLGLACVAAATRDSGHEVILLNLMFEPAAEAAIPRSIESFRPDVIGISVRNIDDQNMERPRLLLDPVRQVVAQCRKLCRAPVVVGGAGYSIFPESALRYLGADAGIPGEGEAVFPDLLERIGSGRELAGREVAKVLDELPLPDPALWIPPGAGNAELWVPVQSRRGCPMDCSFCSTSAIEGRSIRRRSPGRVVKWLVALRQAGCRRFCFVDNTFNLPPSYAKELCRAIIQAQLDLDLWCLIYPKWINRELVDLMRRAGTSQISLGFESGSDRVLRSLNKRFNREDIGTVSRMFADAGIERRGFLLLGGPGETRDTVEESLAFADSLNLDGLKITVGLRIYPGTPLERTAVREGLLGAGEDLLQPRFYLARELRDWLPERVARYGPSNS